MKSIFALLVATAHISNATSLETTDSSDAFNIYLVGDDFNVI